MTIPDTFFKNTVNFSLLNAYDRENGTSVFFLYTYNDISPADVIYIISKSANTMNNFVRIPGFFKFNSIMKMYLVNT